MTNKPKIALITTGGTIAMAATGPKDVKGVPKLTSRALLEALPQITDIADIEAIDLFSKPSSSLTLDDLEILRSKIQELSSSVDGIVITHGTDTLEETAFALSLMIKTEIPVVLTGAMRRADLPGADGPANLLAACKVAASAEAPGLGVLVVMNDEIFSGLFVRKSHTFFTHAFSGPSLGWVAEDRVRILYKPSVTIPHMPLGPKRARILIVEGGFGVTEKDLKALNFEAVDALVFNITGVGHISEKAVPILQEIAMHTPVIFASRSGAGETFKTSYGFAGSESDLISKGLIPSGLLNARQARMLLLMAFSEKQHLREDIKELFLYFN